MPLRLTALFTALLCLLALCARGQYRPAELPLKELPTEQEYQRTLRRFLAALTPQDLTVAIKPITAIVPADPEEQYRLWLLSKQLPHIAAATLPAELFTLSSIESKPGLWLPTSVTQCQNLAWLAHWDYAGNPYHGSRPLKLRAVVLAMVDVMMLDYLYTHDPQGSDRSDYLGGNLIWLGYTYSRAKDVLPAPVQQAFAEGLKKLVLRLDQWGPRGLMTDMDLFAPVGLRYLSDAMADTELKAIADRYARRLFTEPHYFHPAGYFVDNDCFDTSYNGISLYFGTWAALMSDWDFARQALDRAYRLRAHLSFPAPDGSFSGPSQMSSRTSADPPHDQWQFPCRHPAAGMISDDALYLSPLPTTAEMQAAPAFIAAVLNQQLTAAAPAEAQPWRETHWSNAINFAHEHYRKGYYARRLQLQSRNSSLLKPLYQRDETFVRAFDNAFVVARFPRWAVALHTGPVGRAIGHLGRPFGYGGGQLSVFWTPSTGAVLAGRRRGVQGAVFDSNDEWREWPVHAVTGLTDGNELLTSARIERPEVETKIGGRQADVRVRGTIPKYNAARTEVAPSGLQYARLFRIRPEGLEVKTTLTGSGAERLTELYESLPVFLREQADQKPASIQFRIKNAWQEAAAGTTPGVEAIRIQRYAGAVEVTFSRPRAVRIAPQPWLDGFQTRAECRTILVDLLEGASRDSAFRSASVQYTLRPAVMAAGIQVKRP